MSAPHLNIRMSILLLIGLLLPWTRMTAAQLPVLNIGYINASETALVQSFNGALRNDSVDSLLMAMKAGMEMALTDLRADGVLSQYELRIVSASLDRNSYSSVYNAATELIRQNVAVIIMVYGNIDMIQYVVNICSGFKIPLLTLNCPFVVGNDNPCFSAGVRGEAALQHFKAAARLGLSKVAYVYNPLSLDSGQVEAFAAEMSSQIDVRTYQIRSDITNATVKQIVDSRVSGVILTNVNAAPGFLMIKNAVGPERAKMYTFMTTFAAQPLGNLLTNFPIGHENGLFVSEGDAPADLSAAFTRRAIADGYASYAQVRVNASLTAFLTSTGYRYYHLLRLWAYGFEKLVAGRPANTIASSLDQRPTINRTTYFSNVTINSNLGTSVKTVSGVPFLFNRFSIVQPNMTEFNKTRLWTPAARRFLGFVDAPGLITNGTYGDGSSTPPPAIVPLPIWSFANSPIRNAGYAVGGITIAFNLILLVLLLALRSSVSVKSASWVFMGTTLVGSIALAVTLFLATGEPNYGQCNATPVLITLGIHLIVVSVAVKAFRLATIFHNKHNRRVDLQDSKLAMVVGCLYIPDIIILAVWLGTQPLTPVYVEEGDWQIVRCYSSTTGYPWGLFGYGVAKLSVALRYTYLTRNVYSQFNETKAVLFAVYNVIIGLVIGLVSFVITGMNREGEMILLLIALAVVSFGTSASIVGSRVFYAFFQTANMVSVTIGSTGQSSKTKLPTPQILARPGKRDQGERSFGSTSGGAAAAVVAVPKDSNQNYSTTGVTDEDYKGKADLSVFEGSIRRRSLLAWFSRWYSGLVMIGKMNPEPGLIISMWDDVAGTDKLGPSKTVCLTRNQIAQVSFLGKNHVTVESAHGVFDLDLPNERLATHFVETYTQLMGKVENKSASQSAGNV
ncbi:hypothetical protein HK102_009134 [Quaeritorhiza haematococci]|nr:hypothetical protein HK102_009134 [Quaeritorhiza haematococci]